MKRVDGRFSLDQRMSKNLRAGISASYANTVSYGTVAVNGSTGGVVQGMWQYRPTIGLGSQDVANNLIDSVALQDFINGTATTSLGDNLVNPLLQAQNEYRKTTSNTAYINAYLEYSFLKDFKFKVSGGYTTTNLRLDQFFNSQTQQGNLFKMRLVLYLIPTVSTVQSIPLWPKPILPVIPCLMPKNQWQA